MRSRVLRQACACLCALGLLSARPATALEPLLSWSPVAPPMPAASAGLVHDSMRDRYIAIGGWFRFVTGGSIPLDRLAVCSPAAGGAWSTVAIAGTPPAEDVTQAFYDAARDRLVCVTSGGAAWIVPLSGTPTWSPMAPAVAAGSVALDVPHDRLLLARRYGNVAIYQLPLAGGTWTQIPSSGDPHERYDASLVYDPGRNDLVLFGGRYFCLLCPDELNETWRFDLDNGTWTQVPNSDPAPDPRYDHAAIFDASGDRMLVFGGVGTNGGVNNNLWELSLAGTPTWTHLGALVTPQPRFKAALAVDLARERMLVFGGSVIGSESIADLWAFDMAGNGPWTDLTPVGQPPSRRYGAPAVFDPEGPRMLVLGGYDGGFRNDVTALTLGAQRRWEPVAPAGTPPAGRYFHSAAYDAVRQRVLVFGGYDGSNYRADTWALNLGSSPSWSFVSTTGSPPSPRAMHSAVIDPAGDRMLVFGGETGAGTYAADVRALNLSTGAWTAVSTTGTPPSARRWHSAVWDPSPGRMVVFGGRTAGGVTNELWQLSSAGNWSTLSATGTAPSARDGATAAYDPLLDRMIFHSGENITADQPDDTWILGLGATPVWTGYAGSLQSPGPVAHHACAYSPTDGQLVVFGGSNGGNLYCDPNAWVLQLAYPVSVPSWPSEGGLPLPLTIAPNPSSGAARVRFALAAPGHARLEVLDLGGRVVRTLVDGMLEPGTHDFGWTGVGDSGRRLASGIYWVRLRTERTTVTRRLAWLR